MDRAKTLLICPFARAVARTGTNIGRIYYKSSLGNCFFYFLPVESKNDYNRFILKGYAYPFAKVRRIIVIIAEKLKKIIQHRNFFAIFFGV